MQAEASCTLLICAVNVEITACHRLLTHLEISDLTVTTANERKWCYFAVAATTSKVAVLPSSDRATNGGPGF